MMPARARGFSLLEAIVALVILSAAMLGAYGWLATDVRALQNVRALALEEAAVQQALAQLEQTDLAAQPSGSIAWRDYRIEWNATALEPARAGRSTTGQRGSYELTLHRVSLAVFAGERLIGTPQLRMVQYTAARDAQAAP